MRNVENIKQMSIFYGSEMRFVVGKPCLTSSATVAANPGQLGQGNRDIAIPCGASAYEAFSTSNRISKPVDHRNIGWDVSFAELSPSAFEAIVTRDAFSDLKLQVADC